MEYRRTDRYPLRRYAHLPRLDYGRITEKLLDQMRAVLRSKHYSRRTEESYVHWITGYVRFHQTRHPRELGSAEISAFLTHLTVDLQVAAATQNQARSALLFLYHDVLGMPIDAPRDVVAARTPIASQPCSPRTRRASC
jgi:hypothetical protein